MEFLHPNVASRIIDNSVVAISASGGTLLYAAFPAERGPDNQMQLVTSESERAFFYGAPNLRKYGQTAYNVQRWLNAGGQALCFRVLPYRDKDEALTPIQPSTFACYIVEVGLKTGSPKQIKIRVRTLGDGGNPAASVSEGKIRDDASIAAIVLAPPGGAEPDGFNYWPLMAIRGRDRGAFYNSFGVSLDLMNDFDETFEHRLYRLQIFSSKSRIEEERIVSLYPEAKDNSGLSQFIVDVLASYSSIARCIFKESSYDAIVAYINSDASVAKKIDIIGLAERNVSPAETLHTTVTVNGSSKDLSPASEIFWPMGGGTDGTWTGPNSLDSLLFKAYSGSGDEIDPTTGNNIYSTNFSAVLDKRAYPVDIMMDANYASAVKVAMANLAASRGDCMALLDIGFTPSPAAAEKYRQNTLNINSYFAAIFGQDFVVFDGEQGTDIRVTPTYFLADKIPNVDKAEGLQVPFVGPRRGEVVGFKTISWAPDEAWKERLYKAGVNYIERDVQGTRFMTQKTSQKVNSALSDIANVRALLQMRRESENISRSYQLEFQNPRSWSGLQYDLSNYNRKWISNSSMRTATTTVYASEYDRQQRIVRVRTEVQFTGFIERIFMDFVVNR